MFYLLLVFYFLTAPTLLTSPLLRGSVPPFHHSVFERYPYLQNMTSYSAAVLWETKDRMSGILSIKTENSKPVVLKEKRRKKNHLIRIHNLSPDTIYWYQIISSKGSPLTPWIWFKTFPTKSYPHFSFAVFGDSGNGSVYQKKVAHQIFIHHPNLILQTGDLIYGKKTPGGFNRKFFWIYWKTIESSPIYPVLGNHDLHAEKGEPLLKTFVLPNDSPGKGKYFSFNCGDVHFIALDSMAPLAPGTTQYKWLIHDLSKTKMPLKIVYFHFPLYSSGFHGGDLPLRKALAPIFKTYHVSLVFNGHDHDYERTIPIHGTIYVVTGGGGGMLYPVWASKQTAYAASVHHFVWCRVNGKKISCDAIDDHGRIFDRFMVNFSR